MSNAKADEQKAFKKWFKSSRISRVAHGILTQGQFEMLLESAFAAGYCKGFDYITSKYHISKKEK